MHLCNICRASSIQNTVFSIQKAAYRTLCTVLTYRIYMCNIFRAGCIHAMYPVCAWPCLAFWLWPNGHWQAPIDRVTDFSEFIVWDAIQLWCTNLAFDLEGFRRQSNLTPFFFYFFFFLQIAFRLSFKVLFLLTILFF